MNSTSVRYWSILRTQLIAAVGALLALVSIGTVVYHVLEKWSWVVSFYFSVCTLTTVGYGDYYPTSDLTRLFTAAYVLVGVIIAFGAFGMIGAGYVRRSQEILRKVVRIEEEKEGQREERKET